MTIDAGTLKIDSYPRLSESTRQIEAKNGKELAQRNYAFQLIRLYDFTPENQGNFRPNEITTVDFQDRFEPLSRGLLADVISARLELAKAQEREISPKDAFSDERKPLDAEIRRCEGALGVVNGWRKENSDPLISLIHDLNNEARDMSEKRRRLDESHAPWWFQRNRKVERDRIKREAGLMQAARETRIYQVGKFVEDHSSSWLAEKPQVHPDRS